jgi:two-component system nitrogen regulation response regulator NtrX
MPKKIIVVDDEKIICNTAKKILEMEGYEVDTFTNSVLALEAIRKNQYDLIITDLMMEEVSGMDILREVNLRSPHPGTDI